LKSKLTLVAAASISLVESGAVADLQATTARADDLTVSSHMVGVRCAYDAK